MQNCLATIVDECETGEFLAFSVRRKATGKRIGNFAVCVGEDNWDVLEICGFADPEPNAELVAIAESVQALMNK